MTFEKDYPIEGQFRLSYTNPDGMVFQIIPLFSLQMPAEQILAELKLARIKLNEAVVEWNSNHIKAEATQ